MSARSVFDASAHVRFPLAVIPRFLLAAIDATPLFADPPLDAHVGGDVAVPARRRVAASGYANSPAGRERKWALALTTRARGETNLDVMDIITHTDALPKASPVAMEVSRPAAAAAGRKYAVELIGTFFLVFTVATSVLSGSAFAPLAIGAALMVMIYAGGHISGGHYNPAVTIAALVRGRIGLPDAVGYWIAQLIGGLLAAATARWAVHPAQVKTLTLSGHLLIAAFVVELLFTFALCYVMLNVATSKSHPNNSFYGLAIGFTVLTGAIAVGAISGGAFNPAVTIGGAAIGLFAWLTLWVYLVAQVVAGAAAGLAFLTLNPDDK